METSRSALAPSPAVHTSRERGTRRAHRTSSWRASCNPHTGRRCRRARSPPQWHTRAWDRPSHDGRTGRPAAIRPGAGATHARARPRSSDAVCDADPSRVARPPSSPRTTADRNHTRPHRDESCDPHAGTGKGTPMDDRTGGTWLAGKPDAVPKAPSPCPGPLSGRSKTMPVPDLPEGWGGFSGAKVNVDIRTTIAHPDCHSKNSPGEALRPCYTVISRKTADMSPCNGAPYHARNRMQTRPRARNARRGPPRERCARKRRKDHAHDIIDKWHGPAMPGAAGPGNGTARRRAAVQRFFRTVRLKPHDRNRHPHPRHAIRADARRARGCYGG